MKKKLNTDAITNELEGASLFFTKSSNPPSLPKPETQITEKEESPILASPSTDNVEPVRSTQAQQSPTLTKNSEKAKKELPKKEKKTNRDTMPPRYHDTTVSLLQETTVEIVRKAVKELGKEAATHRFTQAEKRAVADIIYTYKNNGIKTSENEIARIAVNFLVEDYRENGENSILHKILKALNE